MAARASNSAWEAPKPTRRIKWAINEISWSAMCASFVTTISEFVCSQGDRVHLRLGMNVKRDRSKVNKMAPTPNGSQRPYELTVTLL